MLSAPQQLGYHEDKTDGKQEKTPTLAFLHFLFHRALFSHSLLRANMNGRFGRASFWD
jgi:hypothetical protein